MTIKFYVIADTAKYGEYGKKNLVTLDTHEFDWDNEEDRETVEEYIESLSPENFKQACRNYLIDAEIDWEQRLIPYLLLDEEQYALLKKIIA